MLRIVMDALMFILLQACIEPYNSRCQPMKLVKLFFTGRTIALCGFTLPRSYR